jgi:hypothetical protein
LVTVECPVDGCDYEGSVGSVEGHISGSQSGDHDGWVGRDHRKDLVEQAEGSLNESDGASTLPGKSPDGSRGEDQSESGGDSATQEGVDIAPSKALIGATLAFVVISLATSSGSGESEASTSEARTGGGDQADGGDDLDGGLVG